MQGAGVIDQDVDPPETLHGSGNHGFDFIGVTHVGLDRQGLATERFHFRCGVMDVARK